MRCWESVSVNIPPPRLVSLMQIERCTHLYGSAVSESVTSGRGGPRLERALQVLKQVVTIACQQAQFTTSSVNNSNKNMYATSALTAPVAAIQFPWGSYHTFPNREVVSSSTPDRGNADVQIAADAVTKMVVDLTKYALVENLQGEAQEETDLSQEDYSILVRVSSELACQNQLDLEAIMTAISASSPPPRRSKGLWESITSEVFSGLIQAEVEDKDEDPEALLLPRKLALIRLVSHGGKDTATSLLASLNSHLSSEGGSAIGPEACHGALSALIPVLRSSSNYASDDQADAINSAILVALFERWLGPLAVPTPASKHAGDEFQDIFGFVSSLTKACWLMGLELLVENEGDVSSVSLPLSEPEQALIARACPCVLRFMESQLSSETDPDIVEICSTYLQGAMQEASSYVKSQAQCTQAIISVLEPLIRNATYIESVSRLVIALPRAWYPPTLVTGLISLLAEYHSRRAAGFEERDEAAVLARVSNMWALLAYEIASTGQREKIVAEAVRTQACYDGVLKAMVYPESCLVAFRGKKNAVCLRMDGWIRFEKT